MSKTDTPIFRPIKNPISDPQNPPKMLAIMTPKKDNWPVDVKNPEKGRTISEGIGIADAFKRVKKKMPTYPNDPIIFNARTEIYSKKEVIFSFRV